MVLADVDLAVILVEVDAVCDDGLFFDWPPLGGASRALRLESTGRNLKELILGFAHTW